MGALRCIVVCFCFWRRPHGFGRTDRCVPNFSHLSLSAAATQGQCDLRPGWKCGNHLVTMQRSGFVIYCTSIAFFVNACVTFFFFFCSLEGKKIKILLNPAGVETQKCSYLKNPVRRPGPTLTENVAHFCFHLENNLQRFHFHFV